MSDEVTPQAPKKRERKPKLPNESRRAARRNISLDAEAQAALGGIAEKLTAEFGFRPTLTQTVLWLASRANVS
jgi:hypothetical protein